MQEVNMGTTLYDLNKQLIKQEKPMSKFAINEAKEKVILPWIYNNFNDHFYYMLLCHERRDYTIFRATDNANPKEIADIIIECFDNRELKLYSIEKVEDGVIEIWVATEEEEMFCYYFFPYDEGVIEV